MAGKPQSLSEGQREEVTTILRKQVAKWVLIGLALLGGITGLSLWQIWVKVTERMQGLVAQQFEEPRIRGTLQEVAKTQAMTLISEEIDPEVTKFKEEIVQRLENLDVLASRIQVLESRSQASYKAIDEMAVTLRKTLQTAQGVRDKMVGLQSDVIKMQQCSARVHYYIVKGRSKFPNPYVEEITKALNDMLALAIPDPSERKEFVEKLGGASL